MLESAVQGEDEPFSELNALFRKINPNSPENRRDIGTAIRSLSDGRDVLGKLTRYETSIDRALKGALHELQRLQAARAGQAVAPPAAVDVNVCGGFVSQNRPLEKVLHIGIPG